MELQSPMKPRGYRNLALAMGTSPQFAIFKRFGALNAQNLLYLQAELTVLEERLQKYIKEDQEAGGDGGRDIYDRDWETLKNSCDPNSAVGSDYKQWRTFLEIREKLKEYSKVLQVQKEGDIANER